MRIFAALLVLAGLGVCGWLLIPKGNTDSVVQSQADSFASATFYQQNSSAGEQTAPTVAVPEQTQPVQATPDTQKPVTNINQNKKIMFATLHTNQGDIKIEFFESDAPKTVANFTKLAEAGFYNGTKFHRVIESFMIQGGDPLSKDDSMQERWGTGGPGYQFEDEIRANNKNNIGTISMANAGPNTNGSQFFINVANNNFLDGKHTTFGKVVSGMDVVTKIEKTQTGASDRPASPMVINSITLE